MSMQRQIQVETTPIKFKQDIVHGFEIFMFESVDARTNDNLVHSCKQMGARLPSGRLELPVLGTATFLLGKFGHVGRPCSVKSSRKYLEHDTSIEIFHKIYRSASS